MNTSRAMDEIRAGETASKRTHQHDARTQWLSVFFSEAAGHGPVPPMILQELGYGDAEASPSPALERKLDGILRRLLRIQGRLDQVEAVVEQRQGLAAELAQERLLRFTALSAWWHDATDYLSSPSEKAAHPAYQQIVDMGTEVLPYIFQDLRDHGGGDWYVALRRIVGSSPVRSVDASSSQKVLQSWLKWAEEHHYI